MKSQTLNANTTTSQFSQPSLLPLRPLLPPLYCHCRPAHRILLIRPLAALRRPLRIPAAHVHQLVLGSWSGRELDRLFGGILYVMSAGEQADLGVRNETIKPTHSMRSKNNLPA